MWSLYIVRLYTSTSKATLHLDPIYSAPVYGAPIYRYRLKSEESTSKAALHLDALRKQTAELELELRY